MNLYEFLYLGFYMGFLTAVIVMVQLLEVTKVKAEQPELKAHVDTEAEAEAEAEEEVEEEVEEDAVWKAVEDEPPVNLFNPEEEPYTMTENPMFRHRVNHVEPVS